MRRCAPVLVAALAAIGGPAGAKTYDSGRLVVVPIPMKTVKPARATVPEKPAPKIVTARLAPPVPLPVTPPRIDPASPLRQPAYPEASKRFEEQGNVTVGVLVLPTGRVARSWVEQSSGHRRLDEAAVETARSWEFIPALQGDAPVAAKRTVVVRFALEN